LVGVYITPITREDWIDRLKRIGAG
jgi:hypothetical protein